MKRRKENDDKTLRQALGLFGDPPAERMESARDHVLKRLGLEAHDASTESILHSKPAESSLRWRLPAFAAAAALILAVVFLNWGDRRAAFLETADGKRAIEYGEIVRSDSAGSVLALEDGSRIEMRAESELWLERAADGVRIRLSRGSLMVDAARQRSGHLYVETQDVLVSVVGTVFLVESAESGSRVVVIEGEVRVQQGDITKHLLPGDKVMTAPSVKPLPVSEEVSWSRGATGHVALLRQATAAPRTGPAPALRFSVASIRPADPSIPIQLSGFSCHGAEGNSRAPFGERPGPALTAPQGRCIGNGVLLSDLIEFAYGVPHRYGPDVPGWAGAGTPTDVTVEGPLNRTVQVLVRARYQVEAVVDDPSTTTTDQMRQMLQTLLADRFQLRFHREIQTIPGYALRIARRGTNLTPASGDEIPLTTDFTDPGAPVLRGRSTVDELVQFAMRFSNPTGFIDFELPSYIVNRTGLTGTYDFALNLPVPGGNGGRGNNTPPAVPLANPRSAAARYAWRAPALAAALEEQLGLLMQIENVPVEILVVDDVKEPSAN